MHHLRVCRKNNAINLIGQFYLNYNWCSESGIGLCKEIRDKYSESMTSSLSDAEEYETIILYYKRISLLGGAKKLVLTR
jgi:hypothetical protein